MNYLGNTRLTNDSWTHDLERDLLHRAIEEHFRPRPFRSLGHAIAKLFRTLFGNLNDKQTAGAPVSPSSEAVRA
jgi:hypothetical protein